MRLSFSYEFDTLKCDERDYMNKTERPFVTIVSGLPRSGTSMMMQMLEASGIEALTDRIREADDDNPQGYYELEAVKKTKSDSSWLENANGHVIKVIYMLLTDLPARFEYRVVFMNRDLDEVLASQSKMLERRGQKGASVSNEQLKSIFEKQVVESKSWLASQPNFKVLYLDYRSVVNEPEANAATINDFLDGGLDTQAMIGAVNSKLYRNRVS